MELNTQQYLRSGKTPEDLKEELGINFKRHTKYPNLISFKYNQIESPRNHPIVNECRGLILNEESNWDVVSFPFCRFFNAEEGHAAEIDWNTAVVQEKLDGCFSYETVIRLWGGGTLKIGEIVNKKLSPTIFGYKDGKVVPSKVTGWHKNGTKNNWLKIVTASGRTLKCTDNHHIMLNGEFKPAALAKLGDKMTRQIESASDETVDDEIVSVEKLENTKSNFPAGRCGYDISTETENYFVKGLLVHNSLLIMYYYNGGWEVTTSGSADAGGNVGLTTRTFREYFWDTARDTLPANWLEKAREDHCYMFELMGPDNRIVVYHPEAHLKLLGCRNLKTLQEIPVKEAIKHFYGVEPVREFQLSSVDEIISTFETLSPTSQEGYVVVDASFNRIKIKSPAYVAIHHAKDGLSTKAFVEIARTGEVWEMIAHFPEYEEPLNEAKQRFSSLVKRLEESYAKIADIENQKEFALANKCEVPGALFALRSGKVASIREFLCNMHIDKIMKLLDYKKRVVKHEEVTKEEIWE